jgi:glycosyltransferase involved in cell wall biosynthesis
MHICFISHEYPKPGLHHGGIGTFLQTICRDLVQAGHKATVVGWHKSRQRIVEVDNGVKIVRTPKPNISGVKWLQNIRNISSEIKNIHKENPIDVIEGQEGAFAFFPKIGKIPFVIRLHGGHHFFSTFENRKVNNWKAFLEKKSFQNADGFIAVSNHVLEVTGRYLSFNNKPTILINYPIDTSRFFEGDKTKIKPFKIVFAGTICEKKGVRQLLQAVDKLKTKFPLISLDLYGRDWHYPNGKSYTEEMKSQIYFDQRVMTFKGPISHELLPIKYEEADICAFPSHGETQGLVAPEAMCMGKVVLFSEIGPGPETIVHGQTGFLCNPHSPDDIGEKLANYFENKSAYSALGSNARAAALKKFDPKLILGKNLEFYASIIN